MKIFRGRSRLVALILTSCNFLSNANYVFAATQKEDKMPICIDEIKIDEKDESYVDEFKQAVISYMKDENISTETISTEDCVEIASRFALVHEDVVDLYCYAELGTVYAVIERGALIKGFEFEFEDSFGYMTELLDRSLLEDYMNKLQLNKGNYVSEYRLSKLQETCQNLMALTSYEGADNVNVKFSLLQYFQEGYVIKALRTVDPDVLISRDMFNIKYDADDLDEDLKHEVINLAMSVSKGWNRFLPTKMLWLSSYVKSMNTSIVPAIENLFVERGYVNVKAAMYLEKGEIFIELKGLNNTIKDVGYSVIEDSFSDALRRKEQEELKEIFEFLQEDLDNDDYTFAEKISIYSDCFDKYLQRKNRVFYKIQLAMLECGSSSRALFWIAPGMKNLQVGNVYVKGTTKLDNVNELIPYIGQSKGKPFSLKDLAESERSIKAMKFVKSCNLQPILNKNNTVDILCTIVEKSGGFALPGLKVKPLNTLVRVQLILSTSATNIMRSSNSFSCKIISANRSNYLWRNKNLLDVRNAFVAGAKSHLKKIKLSANFTTVKLLGPKNPSSIDTTGTIDVRNLFSDLRNSCVLNETTISQSIGDNLSVGSIRNHKSLTTSAYAKLVGSHSFKDKSGRQNAIYKGSIRCLANLEGEGISLANSRFCLDSQNSFKKQLGRVIWKLTIDPKCIYKNGNKFSSSIFSAADSILAKLPSTRYSVDSKGKGNKVDIAYVDSEGNKVDISAKREALVNIYDHVIVNFRSEFIYPFNNFNNYNPSKHISINFSNDFQCSNERLGGGKGEWSKYADCKVYGRCPIKFFFITFSINIGRYISLLPDNQPVYSLGGGDWTSIKPRGEKVDSSFLTLDFNSFSLA